MLEIITTQDLGDNKALYTIRRPGAGKKVQIDFDILEAGNETYQTRGPSITKAEWREIEQLTGKAKDNGTEATL